VVGDGRGMGWVTERKTELKFGEDGTRAFLYIDGLGVILTCRVYPLLGYLRPLQHLTVFSRTTTMA